MRRSSNLTMYIVASFLCIAGVIMAIMGDVWEGKTPLVPGSTLDIKASQPPAQVGVHLDERYNNGSVSSTGRITSETSIFWVTRYTSCGHEIVREKPAESSMIGKTFAEFSRFYPECTMEITGGQLRMIRTYDQYCPDHYIIKSDTTGTIYVYRNMEGKDKLSMVTKMNFTVDSVPQDYRPLLKDGMAFGSIEEIEGLIEDAET